MSNPYYRYLTLVAIVKMPSERLSRWHLTAMDISFSDYFSRSATALYTTSPSTMFSPALSAASS